MTTKEVSNNNVISLTKRQLLIHLPGKILKLYKEDRMKLRTENVPK